MIEEIKQIIADNSEEKHFVEYGKGVFATEDAVDEIAESVVKLFSIHNVSNSLSGFRKWQKENWKDVYLMSDEFMIKTYLDTL